ncbi:MAG: metallophosphoesterase [Oscillospiraceae bacterium]|nr:metallophosphoesterase [Oscillospiraceae bacterium]
MSLYAIGDLHLSFGSDKNMDVFGGRWENYVEKIQEGFAELTPQDTTVLCGDLSWGMDFDSSKEDFLFIHRLPGKKIILKGNHDYWWCTAAKAYSFFAENGIDSIEILHNNCQFYGDFAICGTRGWFYEEERGEPNDKKVLAREIMRLETSLKAAGEREKLCFLHYPPKTKLYECAEITDMLAHYGVKICCCGHLHGYACSAAFTGEHKGVGYRLVSADYLNFKPLKLID